MILVQFCVRKQVLGRSNFEPAKTDAKACCTWPSSDARPYRRLSVL